MILDWLRCIVPLLLLVPAVAGGYHVVPGVASKDVLDFVVLTGLISQALSLPLAVVEGEVDEDED